MTTRRHILKAGVALGVFSPLVSSQAAPAEPTATPLQVDRILVDSRFENSRVMAERLQGAGLSVIELPRDVLTLWHDEVLPDLRTGRIAALGGVTSEVSLFLLRTLAADHRLRVVYQTVHSNGGQGVVSHRMSGRSPTLSPLAAAVHEPDWRRRFAEAFFACHNSGRSARRTLLTAAPARGAVEQPLVSWVLAAAVSAHS